MTPDPAPYGADLPREISADLLRRVRSNLIAISPLLDTPYPDDPRWTPWSRFAMRSIGAAEQMAAALDAANAEVLRLRAEVLALRAEVGDLRQRATESGNLATGLIMRAEGADALRAEAEAERDALLEVVERCQNMCARPPGVCLPAPTEGDG